MKITLFFKIYIVGNKIEFFLLKFKWCNLWKKIKSIILIILKTKLDYLLLNEIENS